MQKQIKAAAVLIIKNNKILSVSRKHDHNDFGLPGGKLELNETFEEAAARECFEETGIRVFNLKEIYHGTDDVGYDVKTFVPEKYFGEIKTSEEGVVAWQTQEKLMQGTFGNYNKTVFQKVGLI